MPRKPLPLFIAPITASVAKEPFIIGIGFSKQNWTVIERLRSLIQPVKLGSGLAIDLPLEQKFPTIRDAA
jgi:hypothetical protein